jgi:alditol oxidase
MKRKTFLQSTGVLAAGSFIPSIMSCNTDKKSSTKGRKNWAGNYAYAAKDFYEPNTVDEVVALVKKLSKQKALGSTHCFNNIADSPLAQISTRNLSKVISIDKATKTIVVEAGARYGQFAPELDKKGFALHNLASLPHISVGGAISTATHGSGIKNGNLASAVNSLEIVNAKGEIINLSRAKDGENFNAAVVGLGALGIITKVGLDIVDTYKIRQDVFLDLTLDSLKTNFESILASGYSVSLFTDWQNQIIKQVWLHKICTP